MNIKITVWRIKAAKRCFTQNIKYGSGVFISLRLAIHFFDKRFDFRGR